MATGSGIASVIVALCLGTPAAGDLPPAAARRVDLGADVRPILTANCLACHGPDKQKGGLRLDRKADALRGGGSGPVIVAGDGGGSELIHRVAGDVPDRVMPPTGNSPDRRAGGSPSRVDRPGSPVAGRARAGTIGGIGGRSGRSQRPAVPALASDDATSARNPIDAFVLATLRQKGLTPSPEADRRTLVRRLTFDLIGLPPTPEEVEAFVATPAADAYERLVDRLLASPRYGERWARHWLDVVHYGDTHGYDKDQPRPNAWPYRDYVIRSFNEDKPYATVRPRSRSRATSLFPGTADGVAALGFHRRRARGTSSATPRCRRRRSTARSPATSTATTWWRTTLNTFVSLTVQCAQCHDHKFDPIPQEDYYRLQAVFAALDRADRPYYADPAVAR